MIIDSHVHLKHGDAKRTEYSPKTIVKIMNEVGIDKSIVFAMSTTTKHSIEMAKEATEKFPEQLIPYVYALPNYERAVLKEIEEAILKFGFKGIKIHLGECTLAEYVIDPVIEIAGKYNVPCLIDYLGRDEDIKRIAKKFPETKIIIAHLGKYLCTDNTLIDKFISIAENYNNIYLDISGVVIPYKIEEAVHRISSERVIFGTDGPHKAPDLVRYAQAELNKIKMLNLTRDEKDAVLGGSIVKLLRI